MLLIEALISNSDIVVLSEAKDLLGGVIAKSWEILRVAQDDNTISNHTLVDKQASGQLLDFDYSFLNNQLNRKG
ncbi:Uncharacterised protein [Legionella maceachernii]|nr:Uncharacterised protein [Legionella maceachernii]